MLMTGHLTGREPAEELRDIFATLCLSGAGVAGSGGEELWHVTRDKLWAVCRDFKVR